MCNRELITPYISTLDSMWIMQMEETTITTFMMIYIEKKKEVWWIHSWEMSGTMKLTLKDKIH